MKKSLRLPFSLLLFLLVTFTFLLSRSAIHNGFGSIPSPLPVNTHPNPNPNPNPNSTLLSLSSNDAFESDLKRAVEDLIEGNLPVTGKRTISQWRRENHYRGSGLENRLRSATRYPIRFRSPKDYRIFPEFRRSLRDWIRNRYLQPRILSDLAVLVKRPLDRHFNGSEPDKNIRLYNSCAVVGNSGILLKSEYGEVIDGHEMVIRLNNARIQGYSRYVGSKTTLSFVNSNILHLCARREGCFCHPYGENVPMIMYICQPIHFLDYITCNSSHKPPLLITDGRFDVLCGRIVKYYSMKMFVEETRKLPEEWGKVKDEKLFHYSSGMQAVMLAVGICEKVSIFGFGKSSEAKHHYHTNQKAELDLHDYEAEYRFYHDLVERPEVDQFLREVESSGSILERGLGEDERASIEYMQRFDSGFGLSGASYPMQPRFSPAVNYSTEFFLLASGHMTLMSVKQSPRAAP